MSASSTWRTHPRAAAIGTNSRGGKAQVVIPVGYIRCQVCTNKCRAHGPDKLRAHRDLHGFPCYNRDRVVA